jgi:hypothetical protein
LNSNAAKLLLPAGPGGSLALVSAETLVASNLLRQLSSQESRPRGGEARTTGLRKPQRRPLQVIQGSLSSRQAARRSPLLAGLHRAADGTLAGLGLCMLALSGLTLHWQNHWGQSFQQLESAQVLEHRLQESAAQLEQHYLGAVRKPGWLVPTSSEKLIYLPSPSPQARTPEPRFGINLAPGKMPAGY